MLSTVAPILLSTSWLLYLLLLNVSMHILSLILIKGSSILVLHGLLLLLIEFVIKLPVLSVDVIDLIPNACVEKIPYGPKGSPD